MYTYLYVLMYIQGCRFKQVMASRFTQVMASREECVGVLVAQSHVGACGFTKVMANRCGDSLIGLQARTTFQNTLHHTTRHVRPCGLTQVMANRFTQIMAGRFITNSCRSWGVNSDRLWGFKLPWREAGPPYHHDDAQRHVRPCIFTQVTASRFITYSYRLWLAERSVSQRHVHPCKRTLLFIYSILDKYNTHYVQGYLAHKKYSPPWDHQWSLGIGLL